MPRSAVDLDAGTLEVRQQLQRLPGKGLLITPPKSGSDRTIPLPPAVVASLRKWRKQQAIERLAAGSLWKNEHDLVFTTQKGTPVDPDNFRH